MNQANLFDTIDETETPAKSYQAVTSLERGSSEASAGHKLFMDLRPGDLISFAGQTLEIVGHPRNIPGSTLARITVNYHKPKKWQSETRWQITRWEHDEIVTA